MIGTDVATDPEGYALDIATGLDIGGRQAAGGRSGCAAGREPARVALTVAPCDSWTRWCGAATRTAAGPTVSSMTVVALVVAAAAALLHVVIWSFESVTWRQPATWRRFGVTSQADADATAAMAYNQGFYNLFLAVVTAVGIVLVATGPDAAGWALVFAGTGSMLAAATVLITSGRVYTRPAVTQGTLPLLAVVLGIVAVAS